MSNGGWRSARMGEHPRAWLVWVRERDEMSVLDIHLSFDNEEQREAFLAEFVHDVGLLEREALISAACEAEEAFSLDELEEHANRRKARGD